jgi:hypothetical protein
MTVSARDEAIDAMLYESGRLGTGHISDWLDAIPGDVLVRLAIERGALVQTRWMRPGNPSDDSPDVPLYRLTDQ